MKKTIKDLIEKAWAFAKGNKSIFLSILWGMIEAGLIPLTGGWLIFVRIVITVLGGASLWDHTKSGFFSTKKITIEK
jgi:hypothetical protein